MRAVVVYESMYGNTRAIAEAIATGLGERVDVTVLHADDANAEAIKGTDLVVVGGPTHMHGLSTSLSRRAAAQATEEDGHGHLEPHAGDSAGLRSWLAHFSGTGLLAAAFDTRLDRSAALTGAAARGIARRLRRQGCTLVAKPESFFVIDGEGPLEDGEVARACAWGAALATHIPPEALSSVSPNREGAQR